MTTLYRKLLPVFLERFAYEIADLRSSGHFSDEWLLDGSFNQSSWLHGRLWAAMVRAIPDGFIPNLEILQNAPGASWGSSFRPDMLICGPDDSLEMMVELESTNSSDGRVVDRDINRIRCLTDAEKYPSSALLITVLPSRPVKYLPMYKGLSPASKEEKAQRRENPYSFHHEQFLSSLDALVESRVPISVAWANLDVDGIRLEFWDGRYKRRRFWSTGYR